MKILIGLLLSAVCTLAIAQQHQHYAGQHSRAIKALSEYEIKQYQSGAGMGFAKAAELNHFPGPMHALELADKLQLNPKQRQAIQQLMDEHKRRAREIGAKFVESERSLDALFHKQEVEAQLLEQAVRTAALLQGDYRLSHLETHRQMRALLTNEQIAIYDRLRGYAAVARPN